MVIKVFEVTMVTKVTIVTRTSHEINLLQKFRFITHIRINMKIKLFYFKIMSNLLNNIVFYCKLKKVSKKQLLTNNVYIV